MYHFTDGGLLNVWLVNGYTEHTTPYGMGISFHDLDGLVIAICHALCQKPSKLTGVEFRYIRNVLLLSQKMLGLLDGCTEQAVAKWEKSAKVPKTIDLKIRLLFNEKHGGSKTAPSLVAPVNAIGCASYIKIIVTKVRSKWTSTIELEHGPFRGQT